MQKEEQTRSINASMALKWILNATESVQLTTATDTLMSSHELVGSYELTSVITSLHSRVHCYCSNKYSSTGRWPWLALVVDGMRKWHCKMNPNNVRSVVRRSGFVFVWSRRGCLFHGDTSPHSEARCEIMTRGMHAWSIEWNERDAIIILW